MIHFANSKTLPAHKATFISISQGGDTIASLPKSPRLKFDGEAFGGRADRHKRFVAGIYVGMHKGTATR